ncbi:hypothetical protein BDZ89DRAFT_1079170 [Hymenopellis radicata]|nr:hypothetical protein BDZ89DRAFT_1079170 [Hymenopellis radicata]
MLWGPSLPPELVDIIVQYVQYLSDDKRELRNCTLVSRTWSSVSQRTLFRNWRLDLYSYSRLTKLLHELSSNPHLQTLIDRVLIAQRIETHKRSGHNDVSLPTYMSRLASVLSLLPNLVFMQFYFLDLRRNNGALQYLDLIQISTSPRLVELDIEFLDTDADFHVAFESLEGTNIKRVTLAGAFNAPVTAGASVTRLPLPSLECICLEGSGMPFHFQDWLTRRVDLPNLTQCEIVLGDAADELSAWRDVLLRGFPPLKLFKFQITDDYMYQEQEVLSPLPLAGLHFQHVHLSLKHGRSAFLRQFIEWWSSTFRALSDSEAAIHFTELTFTFTDPENDGALKAAWQSLDDSLSHPVFSTVRSIHFENGDPPHHQQLHDTDPPHKPLITQVAYPSLADKVRLALPRLASRGVLCFV